MTVGCRNEKELRAIEGKGCKKRGFRLTTNRPRREKGMLELREKSQRLGGIREATWKSGG